MSVRLKYLVRVNDSVLPETTGPDFTFRYADIGSIAQGVVAQTDMTTFAAAPSRARRLAPVGATVISTVRTYLRAIARVPASDVPLVFSTGFATLEANSSLDSRYLYYACCSSSFVDQVVARSTGVSYPAITATDLASIAIPVPPLEEQRRIADFLDDQVTLLDRAINLRQHQTSLVEERVFTFISDLLAPPARDENGWTDFPWLANWEDLLVKLGRVCDLRSGLTIDAKREGDTGYPYLRVANVQNGSLDLSEMKSVNVDPALALRCMLRPGDVLMTEGGDLDKLGRGAVWQGEIPNCLHQNHIFALRPHRERLLPEYLAAMTRTHHARRYFEITGNRTTNLASTNSTKILNFRFRLPNLAEQNVLLEQVRKADSAATRAVRLMREQVSLLRERKQALITAAVTGEFDVTTARSVA